MENGRWLKVRRELLQLSQDEIVNRLSAKGFDVTRATVSHWETGRYALPLQDASFATAIAHAYGISVDELLKNEGYDLKVLVSSTASEVEFILNQLPEDRKRLALAILRQFLLDTQSN